MHSNSEPSLILTGLTIDQLKEAITEGVKQQIDQLKRDFQPKEPTVYMTRQQVAELLQVDVSSVHNYSVNGKLQRYKLDGSSLVYYKRVEVESALVAIKN